MNIARVRSQVTPEMVLLAFALLLVLGLMFRTSSGACHHWKDQLGRISGAYLSAAGEKEYPLVQGHEARTRVAREREALRRRTSQVLDDRPFGCF